MRYLRYFGIAINAFAAGCNFAVLVSGSTFPAVNALCISINLTIVTWIIASDAALTAAKDAPCSPK